MKKHSQRPVKLELDGKQRLNKVLAAAGYGSRRSVDELIEQGRVEINGEVCSRLGTQVDPQSDKISVDGEMIKIGKPTYFAVNKPIGVVCTNRDPQGRPRVIDLVPQGARLFSIGRLDRNSTGLILMTNDGTIAQRLTHPKYGVRKTYRVLVAGSIDREELGTLRKGVYLAEGKAKADDARIKKAHKNSTEIEIVLSEGKNREIRRVLARIGHKVLALQRTSVGPIKLANLAEGDYRPLTSEEVEALKKTAVRLSEGKGGLRKEKFQEEAEAAKGKKSKAKKDSSEAKIKRDRPVDPSELDIPEQLIDDDRFITDPNQIPVANWDDDFDSETENDSTSEMTENADEASMIVVEEELTPELEAELDDFFRNDDSDEESSEESNDAMDDSLVSELQADMDDESDDFDMPELSDDDDDDDGEDFNSLMVPDFDADDDDQQHEILEGLAPDAILIKDSNSPWKGKVLGDDAEGKPRRKSTNDRKNGPREGRPSNRQDRPYQSGRPNRDDRGGRGRRDDRGGRPSRDDRGGRDERPRRDDRSSGGNRPFARKSRDESSGGSPYSEGRSQDRRNSRYAKPAGEGENRYSSSDRRDRSGPPRDRSDRGGAGRSNFSRGSSGDSPYGRRERNRPEGGERSGAQSEHRAEKPYGDRERRYGDRERSDGRSSGYKSGGFRKDRRSDSGSGERSEGPRRNSPYGNREGRSQSGGRSFGTRDSDGRSSGPRSSGPRSSGPRSSGPRSGGPRSGGPRSGGPRSGGPRSGGPRPGGSRPGGRPSRPPRRDD